MRKGNYSKQCYGKLKHRTYARAAKVMKRMGNQGMGRLNVYSCPWCGSYHVGKVPNRNGVKSK